MIQWINDLPPTRQLYFNLRFLIKVRLGSGKGPGNQGKSVDEKVVRHGSGDIQVDIKVDVKVDLETIHTQLLLLQFSCTTGLSLLTMGLSLLTARLVQLEAYEKRDLQI